MARWWIGLALIGFAGEAAAQYGLPMAPPQAAPIAEGAAAPESTPQPDAGADPHGQPAEGWPHPGAACPPGMPGPPEPTGVLVQEGKNPRQDRWLYTHFEYLHWWFDKRSVPPLVTTGLFTDPVPGALGQPGTTVLAGGSLDDDNDHDGGRFTLGFWFDELHTLGLEGTFLVLENRSTGTAFGSSGLPGAPLLARPFFNVVANQEDADPLAVPNVIAGIIGIAQERRFFGGEVNLRCAAAPSAYGLARYSLLLGGRFLALDEKLLVSESLADLPGLGTPGNLYALTENFTTYNRFYGGQIGAVSELYFGGLVVQLVGKVALGETERTTRIGATTTVIEPNGVVTSAGDRALLVQPSNAGRFVSREFSVVPELSFNLAYQFNECIGVNVGYTVIYWSDVARPGGQIDRGVNIQPVQPLGQVGLPRPAPPGTASEDLWVQGLALGLQFSY